MMWPSLTKIQYERFPAIFRSRSIILQLGVSLVLNWLIGPFIMLGLSWATLPDLPTYRTGVILVGIARCIAMVVVWNDLAQGNREYCAILVLINSALQLVLYAPLAVLFVHVIGGQDGIGIRYGDVAISVLIASQFKRLSHQSTQSPVVSWHPNCTRHFDALRRVVSDLQGDP